MAATCLFYTKTGNETVKRNNERRIFSETFLAGYLFPRYLFRVTVIRKTTAKKARTSAILCQIKLKTCCHVTEGKLMTQKSTNVQRIYTTYISIYDFI